MPKLDNETILLIFFAIAATALLVQTVLLLVVALSVRKAARSLVAEVQLVRSAVVPILHKTQEIITHVAPKIEETVEDLAEIVYGVRVQTVEVQTAAAETLERFRRQSIRAEALFSNALETADRTGRYVADAVIRPVRQISGILAGFKAALDSLRGRRGR
jgi:uncharacterized protein YoxC